MEMMITIFNKVGWWKRIVWYKVEEIVHVQMLTCISLAYTSIS